ncbi:MerR family transcriptional regulator [Lusitaniella coriacea LEGE 07157]|uniref:MerR family transcriptional regulator n=1 Tax=Lusitaniella coriacea LEGE 07157 TaxID=945747 RepID=A0A8J7DWG4_9CYAN|nr:MerR family transcriptional regulator [Lusitaniella coriacea]MBE9116073.1 MerR family transcriptional regulator [Lusitaniella coriacea LEGE 07157]
MKSLQQYASDDPHWSLEDFVQIVNALLPQYLPIQKAHSRVREEVSPRLVRHHTSLGAMDEPLKVGRYAVYTYRHLLQLLVVRRLMAQGYGASAIDTLTVSQGNEELEALLHGGAQLSVTPANPALGFLQQVQQRDKQFVARPPATISSLPASAEAWLRLTILPGLELHVREDFNFPKSPQERQNLVQLIAQKLFALLPSAKNRHEHTPD